MQFSVHDISGKVINSVELEDSVFAIPANKAVIHQAMVRQRANARVGSADTQTRGEVTASTRKPFRQKGTGMARQGSRRSPLLKGGGVAFGPHPRSYNQRMPKKMRRLALKGLLSAKVSAGEIIVVEHLGLKEPKTKEMVQILKGLGVDSSVLIVTAAPEVNVIKSARNLPKVKTLPAALLNVIDLLSYQFLVITQDGVQRVEQIWGRSVSAPVTG